MAVADGFLAFHRVVFVAVRLGAPVKSSFI